MITHQIHIALLTKSNKSRLNESLMSLQRKVHAIYVIYWCRSFFPYQIIFARLFVLKLRRIHQVHIVLTFLQRGKSGK